MSFDREEAARLTERLRGLKRMLKEMSALAAEGITVIDSYVIAEHPDLDDLGHELRNVYGGAFDNPPA